jgi:hypothetical protein
MTTPPPPLDPALAARVLALEVGMVIRDNDPRMSSRAHFAIREFETFWNHHGGKPVRERRAVCCSVNERIREVIRVNTKYIHLDGKPRRSGWSVVQ